ncbi:hypothetical protein N476_04325 [Pseudoalteromonas luteoviolacea H33]|uniref:Uncharacterized protein n=2 Tax=Pseudoalteromonas luteoviolacea TaxID=43657 RepID=A0A167ACZ5_9GAMM|nr:hypothetical protein N476_04325 [Pseudoalteromonas luteoviolacea H33]KZN70894.1 hypothetical protein N477_05715 [Pseudoalteromonas luteoviolacea H33-S]
MIKTQPDSIEHYPRVSKIRVFNKFIGIPIAIVIFFMVQVYNQSLERVQQQFRLHPQKNDVLFINNFKITAEPRQVLYPYRIAKITKVDVEDQTLSFALSNLRYKNMSRVKRDFVVQRYLFNSYFDEKELKVPIKTMFDEEKVIKINRPFEPLDVENLHGDVEFDKSFEEVPRIK